MGAQEDSSKAAAAATPEATTAETNEPNSSAKTDTSAADTTASTTKKPTTTPSNTPIPQSGIDAHPYARGSVIEVLHGKQEEKKETAYWWSDSDDDEEEEEEDVKAPSVESDGITVRLCDVIDRIPINNNNSSNNSSTTTAATTIAGAPQQFRYYVHYRDFNRRLDEWISMDRIVSPPSIGNAKARALKKQEDKLKRKLAKLEEQQQAAAAAEEKEEKVEAAAGASTGPAGPRMTRRQRRKSDVMTPAGEPEEGEAPSVAAAAAEKEVVVKIAPITAAAETTVIGGQHVAITIPAQELDEHEGLDEASLREHEEVTKVKNVAFMELGEYRMETWYYSPLPKELLSEQGYIEILYVCEFSLGMFSRKSDLLRYQARELPKNRRHPPGNEIYRNGNLSMFEVDGFEERIYCQNLCYIAKLFLDHKTLYFDVDPFLFYVLCEVDDRGFHPVGYYSKEKYSDVGYNLACILTFPSHQRKGYGRFLIAFSYALSQKEERVGSPEKPISDLGQKAYKPYWMSTIVDFLRHKTQDYPSMSIMDISKLTSIMAEDIVFTLNQLGVLKFISGVYFVAADAELLDELAKKHPVKNPQVDPTKLHWTPFIAEVKRDKFSIHSKKPTIVQQVTAASSVVPAAATTAQPAAAGTGNKAK